MGIASRQVSVGTMITQLNGLRGTKDITDWEDGFIESVFVWSLQGKDTHRLSGPQVETVEKVWRKHFA